MACSPTPRFKIPLSRSLLNDPAFSPDPRSHPHFPLANARSYKAPPPKSPPAVSPTIPHTRGPHVLSLPPPPPKIIPDPPQRRIPQVPPSTRARENLKPVPSRNRTLLRKGTMKALVRRLTTRHNLDSIDELDETDPFGGSYHHDGPYEAIASSLAQPSPPSTPGIHHSKRQSDPLPLRPGQHYSAPRVPSTISEMGLPLRLEPGQILQQNTVYSSYSSRIDLVPNQLRHDPNPVAIPRPDHSRSQSLSNPRMRYPEDSLSLDHLHGFQGQPSSSLRAPQERYSRAKASVISDSFALHRDHDAAPNGPHRVETIITPPPRYESRLYSLGPPQSSKPPSISSMSQKMQSTGSAVPPALPPHDPRHKSIQSLDISYTLNTTITHPSSMQHESLVPPRIRHLPKRLVMPAPLQPLQSQPQHKFPPAETATWQDEYPVSESAHVEGQLPTYPQKPRLLRKKSSAFPGKTPIPDHVPMYQDDTTPIGRTSPTKMTNEAQGSKERTRRRRLSKRKDDI